MSFCGLLCVGCQSAAHFPEQDLALRVAALRAASEGELSEEYINAYRRGYLQSSRLESGYLGRIVVGGSQEKHPLQHAFEQGTRDAGKDRSGKWTAPHPINLRTHGHYRSHSRSFHSRNYSRHRNYRRY